jgi:metal-responsive CopG/Arc/MetJ family transcriptional regulator
MKTAISIPDDLFRTAERVASRLGLSRSELYRRALSAFIDRHDDKLVTQALDDVYASEPELGQVDELLQNLQSLSLAAEEW